MSVTGVIQLGQFPIPKYSQFAADTDKGRTHTRTARSQLEEIPPQLATRTLEVALLLLLRSLCFMGNFLLLFQIPKPKAAADRDRQ